MEYHLSTIELKTIKKLNNAMASSLCGNSWIFFNGFPSSFIPLLLSPPLPLIISFLPLFSSPLCVSCLCLFVSFVTTNESQVLIKEGKWLQAILPLKEQLLPEISSYFSCCQQIWIYYSNKIFWATFPSSLSLCFCVFPAWIISFTWVLLLL